MKAGMTQRVAIGLTAAALAVGGAGLGAAQDGTLGGLMGAMDTAQTLEGADVRRARDAKAAAAAANEPQPSSATGAAGQAGESPEAARPGAPPDTGTASGGGEVAGAAAGAATAVASYEPGKHRDPFRPPNLGTAEAARTPLERLQIGQLKLVGVVVNAGAPRAMVEDSSGLGYIVTAGTAIGSSGGVVRRIEPRRVLIEESITNFYGEKEPKEIVMALPEEDRSP